MCQETAFHYNGPQNSYMTTVHHSCKWQWDCKVLKTMREEKKNVE